MIHEIRLTIQLFQFDPDQICAQLCVIIFSVACQFFGTGKIVKESGCPDNKRICSRFGLQEQFSVVKDPQGMGIVMTSGGIGEFCFYNTLECLPEILFAHSLCVSRLFGSSSFW